MKNSVEVVKEQVSSSLGSLFTKEDVIKIIDSIEVGTSIAPNEDIDERLESIENVIDGFESDVEDLNVDENDIEFSLDGNRICVENVELDKSSVEEGIRDLREQIQDLKKMFVVS